MSIKWNIFSNSTELFFDKCLFSYKLIFPFHVERVVITMSTEIGKNDALLGGELYQTVEKQYGLLMAKMQKNIPRP